MAVPPKHVADAASIVEAWVAEQEAAQRAGGAAPTVTLPTLSAVERFKTMERLDKPKKFPDPAAPPQQDLPRYGKLRR